MPESGRSAQTAASAALPRWDLSDLYSGPESDALDNDLATAEAQVKSLHGKFAGKVTSLDGPALGALIAGYEDVQEILGRLMSYAYLYYCTDMENAETGKFYQTMQERVTKISSDILFVSLEINRIDDTELDKLLRSPDCRHYAPWIRDTRAMRPYQMSDELERFMHEKHVTGRGAWTRLFDETVAGLRFPYRGRDLTSAEVLNLLSDRDGTVRKEAAKSLGAVFGDNIRTFALITNTLAKDKEIEDGWRGFARPITSRNVANQVEDEVVDALISAVTDAYPRLSHRYYALKARWFGTEKIDYWDRNAPLPDDDDRIVPWDDAVSMVLSSYRAFSGELADIGQRFFDNDWIDVPVAPGKAPGAFAHPTVPSAHPYLLLNYQGKARDVMTLAHELGHGVHQILAGPQGTLMSDTPLTLAETASVFGEQLTFRAILSEESDAKRRRVKIGRAHV